MLQHLIHLRKTLHQHPELSGQESQTAQRIQDFITKHHPPTRFITQLGGHGLAAVYDYGDSGACVVIRCELDALPIVETNTFSHRSTIESVSHKCGHDGHMVMVCGILFWLKEQHFDSGKVVLLFQPAEETGKGAYAVLKDKRFTNLQPNCLFALHNIPNEPLHRVLVMNGGFSAEVQSFAVQLRGIESHASEPEKGINPAHGMSQIITGLSELNVPALRDENFAVLTPVHLTMGQKAYGVSPSNGELHYTIRTWSTAKMTTLKTNIEQLVANVCQVHQLDYAIDWFEHFPASENDSDCNQIIVAAATTNGLGIQERPYPFKFGEDFGWFSRDYKTGMFGLGSGLNTPALHHADYDFPDELILTGVRMFGAIIEQIMKI